MRSTSACGGSQLVAQPVSAGLHSFLGAGAQRGANAALAGTGHGFSEMHALSIFGVQVWALNIAKKIRRETLQDLARQFSDARALACALWVKGAQTRNQRAADVLPKKMSY